MLDIPTVLGMPKATQFLSSLEVVEYLAERGISVTDQTVRRWAKTGKVPSRRLATGGQFLFTPEDIDALILEPGKAATATA